jgi:hypothetical protein
MEASASDKDCFFTCDSLSFRSGHALSDDHAPGATAMHEWRNKADRIARQGPMVLERLLSQAATRDGGPDT